MDEVEVGLPGPIPYGSVDMMVVSYLQKIPPVCLFNVGDHTFYHCMSASFKTTTTFGLEASGKSGYALFAKTLICLLTYIAMQSVTQKSVCSN